MIDLSGKRCTGALPAGESGEQCRRGHGQAEARECRLDIRLKHPINIGQFLQRRATRLRPFKHSERITRAKEIGNRLIFGHLDALTQDVDTRRCRDRTRRWCQFAGDQLQERRLAGAVTTDKPDTLRAEHNIQIGEKRTTVRREPGQIGECDKVGHGQGFPAWQGKVALLSG
jgi:hypothetical protein